MIDLKGTVSSAMSPGDQTLGPWLLALRSGNPNPGVLRYVLDLKEQLSHDSFLLLPGAVYGHPRVIEVRLVDSSVRAYKVPIETTTGKYYFFFVDPGYVGYDSGAMGCLGSPVKPVVVSILHRL